ncbi:MAG: hypothetical protein AB8G95_10025 [Anaerolineae bacterium]
MELTQAHRLLLQAAFIEDDRAIDAWREWHPLVDWDGDPDPVTFRLLAQLQRNLKHRVGIHQLMNKFAGVARKNWFLNQKTLYEYEPLLQELKKASIVPGVDAALAITLLNNDFQFDRDKPTRLFIQPDQALAAVAAVKEAGWETDIDLSDRWMPGYLAWQRSILVHKKKNDLYVELSWEKPRQEGSRDWKQINPDFLPELPIYLPPKIDCLVQYCERFSELSAAEQAKEETQFSLVANLALIVQSRLELKPINVHLLEGKLAQARVHPFVYEGFEIVYDLFPTQLEEPLVRPTGAATLQMNKMLAEAEEKQNGFWRRFRRVWGGYRQNLPYDLNAWGRLMAFPGYMMARWQLGEPDELVPKLKRSLKHRF